MPWLCQLAELPSQSSSPSCCEGVKHSASSLPLLCCLYFYYSWQVLLASRVDCGSRVRFVPPDCSVYRVALFPLLLLLSSSLSLFFLLLCYSSFFFSFSFSARQRRRHFNSFMILLARSSFSFALIFLRLMFSPLLCSSLPLLLSLRVPHFVVTQIELSRPLAHLLQIGIFNAARTLHHPSLSVADAHSNDAHTLPVAGIAYF